MLLGLQLSVNRTRRGLVREYFRQHEIRRPRGGRGYQVHHAERAADRRHRIGPELHAWISRFELVNAH